MKKTFFRAALALSLCALAPLSAQAKKAEKPAPAVTAAPQDIGVLPRAVLAKDSIKMSITVKNGTGQDVHIQHASGQQYDFQLLDAKRNVLYTWSEGKSFPQAQSVSTIRPGRPLAFTQTLSGPQYLAIRDKIAYCRATIVGSADFLNSQGYEIKLGQGELVKIRAVAGQSKSSMKLGVMIENASNQVIYLGHASAKKYDFELLDAQRNVLYTWSEGQSFAQVQSISVVKPGRVLTFKAVLSGDVYRSVKDRMVYLRAYVVSDAGYVDAAGYELKLK